MQTIRELREAAGLTQVQLANQVGVTPSTVFNWEARKTEPKASQLRKAARLFGVSMDDIDFEPEERKAAG
jgi:putative transcriptional regulator